MRYLILIVLLTGCAAPARPGWDSMRWDSTNPCHAWDAEQRPECKEGGAK